MFRITFPWVALARRRSSFLEARRSHLLTDREFVNRTLTDASEDEKSIAVILRALIAQDCGVPPETLWPDDRNAEIEKLMGGNGFVGYLFAGAYGYDAFLFFAEMVNELDRHYGTPTSLKMSIMDEIPRFSRDGSGAVDDSKCLGEWIASTAGILGTQIPT